MARIIAILNFKGGVGKTTTAINLGAALHLLKKKVLIVDLDFQRNATTTLGFKPSMGDTIYELMTQKGVTTLPIYEFKKDFDFIPSSINMKHVGEQLMTRLRKEEILKRIISVCDPLYDFILIDCPPNGGILNTNAMCAARELLIPLDCEPYSLQGVQTITDDFEDVRDEINPDLKILGYLFTRFDSTLKLHKQAAMAMRDKFPGQILNAKIRKNTALSKASAAKKTIFDYDKSSNGAADYEQLAREITGIKKRKSSSSLAK